MSADRCWLSAARAVVSARCSTTAPSPSKPRTECTSAPPRVRSTSACNSGSLARAASSAARRSVSMPASADPASRAAVPARNSDRATAPARSRPAAGVDGGASAAARSAGDAAMPSLANAASHATRWTAALAGWPAATRARRNSSWALSSSGSRAAARPDSSAAASVSPGGEQAQRGLAKLLHRPGRAPAAGQHQPHIEGGAVPRLHARQELPADLGRGQRTVRTAPARRATPNRRPASPDHHAATAGPGNCGADRPGTSAVPRAGHPPHRRAPPPARSWSSAGRPARPGRAAPRTSARAAAGAAARPRLRNADGQAAAPARSPAVDLSPRRQPPAAPAGRARRPWTSHCRRCPSRHCGPPRRGPR